MTVLLSHSVVLLFFFLTFYGTSLTLRNTNITCDCTFVTFDGSLIFSHIWWYHPHIAQYQHYMWLYFCHILWFPYFFSHLMVPSTCCAIPTPHVTILLSHLIVPLFFFTFYGTILTLRGTNITWLYFCQIRWFLFFFSSHFMIPVSQSAVLTSHVIIILSHSIVLLFISHIWWYHSHIMEYQHHM